MDWTITATQNEEAWFEDLVLDIVAHAAPPLPPHQGHFGHVEYVWYQTSPGVAYVASNGGTIDDQLLVEAVVTEQLRPHGFKRAMMEMRWDHSDLQKTATWQDIEDAARQLIQSGGVQLARNGYNDVVGNVASATKDGVRYDTSIKRDDPDSQAISGSTCTCDWGNFQNLPRTRQWRRFQDRPCKHILATYWQSLATPIDDNQMPLFDSGPAQGMAGKTPGQFRLGPAAPSGQINPGQMQIGPPDPMQAPPQGGGGMPPSPVDALPPFPGDPSQQPQLPPVNPISTPGGKPQTPLNPAQYPAGPGGTFSSWRPDKLRFVSAQTFVNGDRVQLGHDDVGTLVGRSEAHGAGQPYTVPSGRVGEVLGTHPSTGMVNVLYMGKDFEGRGPMEPYGAAAWHFPSSLTLRNDIRAPGDNVPRSRPIA